MSLANTVATATLTLLASAAFVLSRSSGLMPASDAAWTIATFAVIVAGHLLMVVLSKRAPVSVRSHVGWLPPAVAAAGLLLNLIAFNMLAWPVEEWLLALLLTGVGVTFARTAMTDQPQRDLSICVACSCAVVLFAIAGMPAAFRTPMIALAASAAASWLLVTRLTVRPVVTAAYVSATVLAVGSICLVADRWIAPADSNPWYHGWVTSSGGQSQESDLARRGVGDGADQTSSGDSSASLGFDNTDKFSESGRDGLYDLWIESYGLPVQSERQQRMLGLRPQDVTIVGATDRENLKSGRRFDLQRQPANKTADESNDAAAQAAAWVSGELPVYLPLSVFESFDGYGWQEAARGPVFAPARPADGYWMDVVHRPLSQAFSGVIEHEIRIGTLGGSILPLPPNTKSFRLGRVNTPEFYTGSRAGLMMLRSRTLPAGAVVMSRSYRIDAARLRQVEIALPQHSEAAMMDASFASTEIKNMAKLWAGDTPRSLKQVVQVLSALREHVRHQRDYVPPAGTTSIADHIILEARVGTDYQIATSAALMLRSLGYPTRVVSGLFADESDRDPEKGNAPLTARHVHTWIEIRLADGTFVPLDPTPGYPLLAVPATMTEWAAATLGKMGALAAKHPVVLGIFVVGLIWIAVMWKQLLDLLATAYFRARGFGPADSLALIELRARLAGCPRKPHIPVGTYLEQLGAELVPPRYVQAINRYLYGPAEHAADTAPVNMELSEAIRTCSLRALRVVAKLQRNRG